MGIPVLVLVFLIGFVLSALAFLIVVKLNDIDKVSWRVVDITHAVFVSSGVGLIVALFLLSV